MKTRSRRSHHGPGRYVYGWSDPRAWSPSALRRDYYWHKWKGWLLYVIVCIALALLLGGCATTIYGGFGYDIGDNHVTGSIGPPREILFREEAWKNPTGIIGARYPIGDDFELDFRHISSLGSGDDIVNSDNLSFLMKFGGSRSGWGLRDP